LQEISKYISNDKEKSNYPYYPKKMDNKNSDYYYNLSNKLFSPKFSISYNSRMRLLQREINEYKELKKRINDIL